jgi:O-antigen/teichoic acid export membrane protein
MKKFSSTFDLSYLYAFIGEATLALTLAFFIILARVLGPEEYGIFSAAVALAAILSLFIQFGVPTLIDREIAAHPETETQSISLFLCLEALSSIGVLVLLLPLCWILGYRGEVMIISYLAILAEIGRAIIMTLRSSIKGLGWFRAESIAVLIERLVVVTASTIVLFQTKNLFLVMGTIAILRAIHAVGFYVFIKKRVNVFTKITKEKLWLALKAAYPFAISGVLWILYYQVDIVMLKALSTEIETGLYGAAYRILEIFSALPRVIFYVVFTRFLSYFVTAPEQLPEQIYKGSRVLVLTVLPALVIGGMIQKLLLGILYGDEFLGSVRFLSILLPSLSLRIFGSIAYGFLQATRREKVVLIILLISALFNIGVNALLIPQFASSGAAIATFLSEGVMAISSFTLLSRAGYRRASQNLMIIMLAGLALTLMPSLVMVYHLSPAIAISVMVLCIGFLAYRMRLRFFSEPSLAD